MRKLTHHARATPFQMLLVDDDPIFGAVMRRAAKKRGFELVHCASVAKLARVGKIERFDVVLVDYHLGRLKGSTVSDFLNVFFGAVPVAIVSATSDWWFATNLDFSACVKTFIHKQRSIDEILDFAVALARTSACRGEVPDPNVDPDNEYAAFVRGLARLWPEATYRSAMAVIGNRLLAGLAAIVHH